MQISFKNNKAVYVLVSHYRKFLLLFMIKLLTYTLLGDKFNIGYLVEKFIDGTYGQDTFSNIYIAILNICLTATIYLYNVFLLMNITANEKISLQAFIEYMKDKFIKAFMLLLFTNIFLTIIYDLLDIYVIRVIQSEILYKIISMIFVVEIKYYIEILLFVLVIENFTKIEQIKKIKFEIFDFTQFLILFSTIIGIMNFFLYNILIKDIQLTDFMNMITIYRIISIIDFINYITLSILTIFTLTFLYIVILDKKLLNEE